MQEPFLQRHIKIRSNAVRCNDNGATCVESKNPELFFSQKMQRVLQECLMTIRFRFTT